MSSLGVPTERRDRMRANNSDEDTEPLLGEPGDVTQRAWDGFQWNILTGTAAIAQGGIWVLAAIVWSAVFEHDFSFFSYHPLLNAAALLVLVQGILLLQPTHTQKQKVRGAYIHSGFNLVAFGVFIAGLVVIEMNKASHPETRFQSVHGKVGLVMYILIVIQFFVGVAQFYFPSLLGGVDNAKSIYKYHRISGYTILCLALATIALAVTTTFNNNVLHMRLWSIVTCVVLVVTGVFPRIKKSKLGL